MPTAAAARARPQAGDSPAERALFFANGAGCRLYGVLHAPTAAASGAPGVVFCHPLSEERDLSQRALVELARLLARHGHPVLRFDATGCGDSEGDLATVTVASLLQDTQAAISHLIADSAVRRVALVGVRFGAQLARLAAEADERVLALALVAPVVSGRDYWTSLLRSQQMSCLMRGVKAPKVEELRRLLQEEGRVEIKSEYFGRGFADELIAIDLRTRPRAFRGPQFIAGGADEPPNAGLTEAVVAAARAGGSTVTTPTEKVGVFWSSKALYEGYRPTGLQQALLAWLQALPR